MIVGIGFDLCSISRIVGRADDHFLCRVFTAEEREYSSRHPRHLAACWAAREAFAKATGLGMAKTGFCGVSLTHQEGKPALALHSSRARQAAQGCRLHLSLSYEGDMAAAVVILEGAAS